MLASLTMLFDMLGGNVGEEDPFDGKGVSPQEYRAFRSLQLLTEDEVAALQKYKGVTCVVPVKWALQTLQSQIELNSRMDLTAKYNDDFEDLACSFQNKCYEIIMLLQQPIPFAYFHVLKMQTVRCARERRVGPLFRHAPFRALATCPAHLFAALLSLWHTRRLPMPRTLVLRGIAPSVSGIAPSIYTRSRPLQIVVLLMIGYSLIGIFHGEWSTTLIAFAVTCFTMIGLQEIAVSMADPFGDDATDFDTTGLVESAYNNVIDYLCEDFDVNGGSDKVRAARRRGSLAAWRWLGRLAAWPLGRLAAWPLP